MSRTQDRNEPKQNILSLRQRRFVAGYLQGKPMTVAAVEAGYSANTAARGAAELLRSGRVRTAIQEAMAKAGLTEEQLAAVIKSGLQARKLTHLAHEERVRTFRAADWSARHRFLDMALRLTNAYPTEATRAPEETYEERIRRLRAAENAARVVP